MRPAVLLVLATLFVGCTEISRTPAPTPTQPTPPQPTATRPPAGVTVVPPVGQTPAAVTTALTPITPTAATSTGGPVSLNDLQQAWTARGLTVSRVDQGSPATGFSVAPSSLTVAKGGDVSALLVFTYPNQRALEEDWNVSGAPAPKPGKNAGTYAAVWWNQNVMVVLRTRGDASDDEARDAFLALGPAVSPVISPAPPPAATGTVSAPAQATPTVTVVAVTSTPVRTVTASPTLAPPR